MFPETNGVQTVDEVSGGIRAAVRCCTHLHRQVCRPAWYTGTGSSAREQEARWTGLPHARFVQRTETANNPAPGDFADSARLRYPTWVRNRLMVRSRAIARLSGW